MWNSLKVPKHFHINALHYFVSVPVERTALLSLLNEVFVWLFSHGRYFTRTASSLDIDTLVVRPQTVCWVSFSSPMRPLMSGLTFYQPGTVKQVHLHNLSYSWSLMLAFSLSLSLSLCLSFSLSLSLTLTLDLSCLLSLSLFMHIIMPFKLSQYGFYNKLCYLVTHRR